ncbi:hypothetical protein [Roseococcus pinisoli]|uniref:Anti-CBASS protein Acb1 n=1 Tax=Roseococcus pinisoli TaxID=2835040 RepID=A0ABS5QHD0_9PROT|nr:hypothetical protein [Roseococcus pinisoli]MBS7812360.1 hypothetical protein [Roseococcus pinisoli]
MNHFLFRKSEPRPLYVSRRLLNAYDLIKWAKENGFEKTVPQEEMHVTCCYSKTPIDWFAVDPDWNGYAYVEAGGARMVEILGDKGARVLRFQSEGLQWRFEAFRNAGASWDHETYQPHVTLSYESGPADLASLTAYSGPLEFGPEIFAPISNNYQATLVEKREA